MKFKTQTVKATTSSILLSFINSSVNLAKSQIKKIYNYLLWKIEDFNLIPSNKNTLKKTTDLLSYNILDQITEQKLKDIYLEYLYFPHNYELYNLLKTNSKKLKFKNSLDVNDIHKLLEINI